MMLCCFSFWVCWKSSLKDLSSMENEFNTLDLAQQNRVSCTRDVSLLNCFKNVLTNEIVRVLVLF